MVDFCVGRTKTNERHMVDFCVGLQTYMTVDFRPSHSVDFWVGHKMKGIVTKSGRKNGPAPFFFPVVDCQKAMIPHLNFFPRFDLHGSLKKNNRTEAV